MTPTCNGYRLLDATIWEPTVGRWQADVQVDSVEPDFALVDPITLELGPTVSLVGAIHRGGVYAGRWHGRIVGGSGGMSEALAAKTYRVAPLQTVLDDIITDTGESLSSDAVSLLTWTPAHWHRMAGPASYTLHALSDETGYTWRVQRDGSIWLGTDTWPELEWDYTTTEHDTRLGRYTVAPDVEPLATPTITFDGHQLSSVVTTIRDGATRQQLWYDT